MRALLAAGLLLAAFVMPVSAKPADPYLTLDTPGPYHYGGTIRVTAHGDIPGRPDERDAKTWIKLWCFQGGTLVFIQHIFSPAAETPYTMNLGQWGISQWDLNGGGPAECQLWFGLLGHYPKPGTPYTIIDFHVEA